MSEKLLPCPNPWCEKSSPEVDLNRVVGEHFVRCGRCGLCGPTHKTRAEAIAAWNTRAVSPREAALREALEALVKAMDACEPHINGAFDFAALHGANYKGPTYGKELDQARAALGKDAA